MRINNKILCGHGAKQTGGKCAHRAKNGHFTGKYVHLGPNGQFLAKDVNFFGKKVNFWPQMCTFGQNHPSQA